VQELHVVKLWPRHDETIVIIECVGEMGACGNFIIIFSAGKYR